MRPARPRHLRALCCALAATAVLTGGLPVASATTPATAPGRAPAPSAASVEAQVQRLQAEVDRVGEELAAGAVAYEAAEDQLARLTQQQFAAREDREALLVASDDARNALHGLARAAYKGGVPPVMTALLSGDPGALSDLAYVQRSVNRVGATRSDTTRALVAQQVGAGQALDRADGLRREALRQRQALEAQRLELASRTTELTAELERAGIQLVRIRAAEELAALEAAALASRAAIERAAELAAASAGTTYVPGAATAGGGGCQPPGGRAEANGFLSPSTLCRLELAPAHRLRTDAARAFDALNRARLAATGAPLCITDSYRDYPSQVDVFRRKPALAATPGKSQHGWGLAVDLCGGVQTFGTEAHRWMQLNAPAFGWIHPAWAGPRGSRPEPWHWEYKG